MKRFAITAAILAAAVAAPAFASASATGTAESQINKAIIEALSKADYSQQEGRVITVLRDMKSVTKQIGADMLIPVIAVRKHTSGHIQYENALMVVHPLKKAGGYFATPVASTTADTINEDMLAQTDMSKGVSMRGTFTAPDGEEFKISF